MNELKEPMVLHDGPTDASGAAAKWGIPYPVYITETLKKALSPNDFLAGLGVQFSERLDNIMGFLKGGLVPVSGGSKETLPKDGIAIPFVLLKGPYVRELPVSVRAELRGDGGGGFEILLSIIQEAE
jgi:hypothetical protein